MIITSMQNSVVKQLVGLREARDRREQGLTLVDGKREVERAIAAGADVQQIVYCPRILEGEFDFSCKADVVEVSPQVFQKIAFGQRVDGIMAVVKYEPRLISTLKLSKSPVVVILESVEKPGNLGAIIRTCDSAGVEVLLIADPKTDIFNPNVIRASVSTVFSLPIAAGTNEDILAFLKKHRIKTAAAVVQAKSVYTQADLKGPLGIILGSEDKGLSDFWQNNCDIKVSIPMKGLADSLNVSVSAALMIYEALRQRS